MKEVDNRIRLISSLPKVPHGDLNAVWNAHVPTAQSDPYFYERLAVWMVRGNIPRDIKVASIAVLLESSDEECRKTGAALLWEIEPYMVYRVVRFITGYHEKPKTAASRMKPVRGQKRVKMPKVKKTISIGRFNKNPTRYLRTEVEKILRSLESNPSRWDGFFLNDRNALKNLYLLLHISPDQRAQSSLFKTRDKDGNPGYFPPQNSAAWALQQLSSNISNDEKLDIIAQYRIPNKTASSFGIPLTPVALGVMVTNMTPNGILERLDWFKSVGAYDIPEIKRAITDKIGQASTARTATGRLHKRENQGDSDVSQAVVDLQRKRIQTATADLGNVLFAVDFSGSMTRHLEQIILLSSQLVQASENVTVIFFSGETRHFATPPTSVTEARRVLGSNFGGMTSYGSPIRWLINSGLEVERIIFLGDGGENQSPTFANEFPKYLKGHPAPSVTFIRPPGAYSEKIQEECVKLGLDTVSWDWQMDDTGFDAFMNILNRRTAHDLYQEIIEIVPPRPR